MIKKIEIQLYKCVLYVIYDLDHFKWKRDLKPEVDEWFVKYRKQARKYFKKQVSKKKLSGSGASARTNWYGNFYTVTFISPCFTKTPENFGTLVHEAFHVAAEVLRTAGVEESNKSTEAYAYLIGWLSQEMLVGYDEFCDKLAVENAEEISYTIIEDGQDNTGENSSPSPQGERGSETVNAEGG